MRTIRNVGLGIAVATLLVCGSAAPVAAADGDADTLDAGGLPGGIYAGAARPGVRPGRSYPPCPWQGVWDNDGPIEILARNLVSAIFGLDLPDDATVEIGPGEAEGVIQPILGDGGDGVVAGTYEGRDVSIIDKFIFYLRGPHDLGIFNANGEVDAYAEELAAAQAEYHWSLEQRDALADHTQSHGELAGPLGARAAAEADVRDAQLLVEQSQQQLAELVRPGDARTSKSPWKRA